MRGTGSPRSMDVCTCIFTILNFLKPSNYAFLFFTNFNKTLRDNSMWFHFLRYVADIKMLLLLPLPYLVVFCSSCCFYSRMCCRSWWSWKSFLTLFSSIFPSMSKYFTYSNLPEHQVAIYHDNEEKYGKITALYNLFIWNFELQLIRPCSCIYSLRRQASEAGLRQSAHHRVLFLDTTSDLPYFCVFLY